VKNPGEEVSDEEHRVAVIIEEEALSLQMKNGLSIDDT